MEKKDTNGTTENYAPALWARWLCAWYPPACTAALYCSRKLLDQANKKDAVITGRDAGSIYFQLAVFSNQCVSVCRVPIQVSTQQFTSNWLVCLCLIQSISSQTERACKRSYRTWGTLSWGLINPCRSLLKLPLESHHAFLCSVQLLEMSEAFLLILKCLLVIFSVAQAFAFRIGFFFSFVTLVSTEITLFFWL